MQNFRRTIIKNNIINVDTLPVSGTNQQKVRYTKYPIVQTLSATPVDYSTRYVVDGSPDIEYKGIKVVTLNGTNKLNIPVIQNMKTDDWEIIATIKDQGPTNTVNTVFFRAREGVRSVVAIGMNGANKLTAYLRDNTDTVVLTVSLGAVSINETLFRFSFKKVGTLFTLTLYLNGSTYNATGSNDTWDGDGVDNTYIIDEGVALRPLKVGDIRQYVNGDLLDYIPCADGSGTVVANYGRVDRPDATLSNPTAWGGIWFPEDNITKTVWQWNGSGWYRLYGYTYIFANLDFTNSDMPGWERQYTDSDNFSIVDVVGQSFTKAGMFTLSAGEQWTNPETGGSSSRSEIQLKDTGNHGGTYEYEWWFKIDSTYGESADWQIIGQWHDQPDPSIEEGWTNYQAHSPTVAFQYKNGLFYVAVVDNFTTGHVTLLLSRAISKNTWHKVKTKIYWSLANDGTLEVWLDDVAMDVAGQTKYTARNCFNQSGNYLKLGIYRDSATATLAKLYYAAVTSTLLSAV